MKDTKKDFIAAILAIVIILLVILIILVSYLIFAKNDTKKETDEVDVYSVNSSFDNVSIDAINKIDDSKDIVYDEKFEYELNFDGVKFNINSIMPVINMDNDNIKFINEEIKAYYENVKLNGEMYELNYNNYIYDNVLSIVIQKVEKRTDNIKNVSNVLVYNIDINTGEYITNRNLINKKNTSLEKVCLELINNISKDLKTNYNFNISDNSLLIDNKKTAEEYIKEEIYKEKDNNMGNNFKMYINDKGKICILFYVPILNTNEKFTYNTFIINI